MLHWRAWESGVKSLYYLRSKSVQRAAFAGGDAVVEIGARRPTPAAPTTTSASPANEIRRARGDEQFPAAGATSAKSPAKDGD